jgi:hypothetical protein
MRTMTDLEVSVSALARAIENTGELCKFSTRAVEVDLVFNCDRPAAFEVSQGAGGITGFVCTEHLGPSITAMTMTPEPGSLGEPVAADADVLGFDGLSAASAIIRAFPSIVEVDDATRAAAAAEREHFYATAIGEWSQFNTTYPAQALSSIVECLARLGAGAFDLVAFDRQSTRDDELDIMLRRCSDRFGSAIE